jgi:nitrogen fixation/metabolism regulation signal transduction histidine kinase
MTSSAQASAAPKYKRSIRNYLLDAKFQLKWTARILFVALGISGVMGVFLYRTSREVTEQSHKVIEQGEALINESEKNSDLVRMGISKSWAAESPELEVSFNASAEELKKQLALKHQALALEAAQTRQQQRTMMLSLIAGLSLLVILIGLLGIYFTHKVVGPIYKMKLLLKQVGDGKLNFQGKLRKGDELQDFFEVFAAMVEKLKSRQAQEVDELEAAMSEAKATGASDAAIAKIAHVRDEMKAALGK